MNDTAFENLYKLRFDQIFKSIGQIIKKMKKKKNQIIKKKVSSFFEITFKIFNQLTQEITNTYIWKTALNAAG